MMPAYCHHHVKYTRLQRASQMHMRFKWINKFVFTLQEQFVGVHSFFIIENLMKPYLRLTHVESQGKAATWTQDTVCEYST